MAHPTRNAQTKTVDGPVATAGEIFPDGTVIDLVAAESGDMPALLLWNGQKAVIASQVEHAGKNFRPVSLHASILRATRLPTGAVEFGTPDGLFVETRRLFETHLGHSTAEAALLTAWNATTWFPDIVSNPCTLFVHGPDMGEAILLFRLLSCICHHPLLVTEITRPALCSLMVLKPTLLLNQPRMPSRLLDLCCAANYRGSVVPGNRGAVVDLVGPRAIFLGMENGSYGWRRHGLHLALPPARRDLLPLDEATQLQIAQRLQPRYLMYRLRRLREVRQSRFAGTDSTSPTSELARTLQDCGPRSSEFQMQWLPLLRLQEQAALAERRCDPCVAMIEVMWPRLHSNENGMSMRDLTQLTNALLRSRGEIREYSSEELGKKLLNLGLPRHRKNSGMVLVFDRDTGRRIHELARSFGVCKMVVGCSNCTASQTIGE
jgi:hypothetical protein